MSFTCAQTSTNNTFDYSEEIRSEFCQDNKSICSDTTSVYSEYDWSPDCPICHPHLRFDPVWKSKYESIADIDGINEIVHDEYSIRKDREHKKYGGRTMRYNPYLRLINKNPSYDIKRNITFDGNNMTVPITNIDDEITDNFLDNRCAFQWSNRSNVGKKEMWNMLTETLDDNSINTKEKYNRFSNTITTTYEVPIIGNIIGNIITEPTNDYVTLKRTNNWMYWNGKYYDSNYLYELYPNGKSSFRLKSISPIHSQFVPEKDNIVKLKCNIKTIKGLITGNVFKMSNYYARNDFNDADGIIVDFKENCNVTNIVIRGEVPETLKFPNEIKKVVKGIGKFLKKKRVEFGSVNVVRNFERLGYITNFGLYYRNVVTKKWVFVANFVANHNPIIDKVIDLSNFFNTDNGLLTRQLKIVPTDWKNSKNYRIDFFGFETSETFQESDFELEQKYDNNNTVTYIVESLNNNDKMSHDGTYHSHHYLYRNKKNPKNKKRNEFKKIIDEQINDMIDIDKDINE